MKLKLIYPGWLPGTNEINEANRRNRYKGALQKKEIQRELSTVWKIMAGGVRFTRHVTVCVNFYERNRRRDDDNVFGGLKFIMDALQDIGVIENDSPKYCHVLPEVFVDKKRPRIEVLIEEDE